MRKRALGQTGIEVSELCFGTLTIGPLQKNLPLSDGVKLLESAVSQGINFFDTAELYETYPYLGELIKKHPELVICTRSYDYSAEGLEARFEKAKRLLGRDELDLFLLHEQESHYTFEGHREAIERLEEYKKNGKLKALGFSTHRVEGVWDSLDYPNLEVVFALINYTGLGIEDGTREEMEEALRAAKKSGKAVIGMKPFGGGNLLSQKEEALSYVKYLLREGVVDSFAFGIQSEDELTYNLLSLEGKPVPEDIKKRLLSTPRELLIESWCEGCGNCVRRCHQGALRLENGKAKVDQSKCLTCGYCSSVCPLFAIKVI